MKKHSKLCPVSEGYTDCHCSNIANTVEPIVDDLEQMAGMANKPHIAIKAYEILSEIGRNCQPNQE